MTSVAGLPEVLDTSREELLRVIEGIVGEHLAREFDKVGFTFFKGGREVDFVYGGLGIEVKWGSASFRDLRTERGFVLSTDELRLEGEKAIVPVSVFLYLVSSDKILY